MTQTSIEKKETKFSYPEGLKKIRLALQNQILQAVLIIVVALLIFFSTPLTHSANYYYSAADLTQSYTLVNVIPSYQPGNSLLSDPVLSFEPWYMFSRDSLHSGKIPLWNPYNANGVPLLANFQSAVFSPFSLPYYFLSFRQALLVAAFLKLFFIGFFTLLFLKQLKLTQTAALLGAISFMFAGYNILWLAWPLVSTVVVLPAGLYFAEKILSRWELMLPGTGAVEQPLPVYEATGAINSGGPAHSVGGAALEKTQSNSSNLLPNSQPLVEHSPYPIFYMTGFVLSLVVGLLGGHPETFYACFILIVGYVTFRLVNLIWLSRKFMKKKTLAVQFLGRVAQFAGAVALAIGTTALQLIPFVEYIFNSPVLGNRGAQGTKLTTDLWTLAFFPDLLGNGTTNDNPLHYEAVNTVLSVLTNFNEGNSIYTGSAVLFLAVMSLFFVTRDKYIAVFAGAGLLWFLFAFNILNFGDLVRRIPTVSVVPVNRTQPIWVFSACCCAALFVNHLLQYKPKFPAYMVFATVVVGMIFVTGGLVGIFLVIQKFSTILLPTAAGFLSFAPGHIAGISLTLGLGVIVTAALWLHPHFLIRVALSAILLLTIYLQTAYLLKDYNTLTPDKLFYPVSPAIANIQKVTQGQTLLVVSPNTILPDTNLVYKIPMLNNIDAILVNNHMRLYNNIFSDSNPVGITGDTKKFTEPGLKMFGVKYLAVPEDFQFVTSTISNLQSKSKTLKSVGEITLERPVNQTFKAEYNRLQSLSVELATFGRINTCNLNIQLTEVATKKIVTQKNYKCKNIGDNETVTLSFEPVEGSAGKEYSISLNSPDALPGNAITAWAKPNLNYPDGSLSAGSENLTGGLSFNIKYAVPAVFQLLGKAARFDLYKYTPSQTDYFTVEEAVVAQSDTEAFSLVNNTNFDPYKTVVLINNGPGSIAQSHPLTNANPVVGASATILSEEADRIRLQVKQSQPGYLVLAKTFYPGWKAKVNGVETPVLRANYAFSAVKVEPGQSQVDFYYEPDSFKYGFLITAASLILGLVVIVIILWIGRRNRKAKTKLFLPNAS